MLVEGDGFVIVNNKLPLLGLIICTAPFPGIVPNAPTAIFELSGDHVKEDPKPLYRPFIEFIVLIKN